MAYVAVRDTELNHSIGSAFHVGDGVFVTARHVVEGNTIDEVRASEFLRVPVEEKYPEYTKEAASKFSEIVGTAPTFPILQEPLTLVRGPFFHDDAKADVAVFQVQAVHPRLPFVPLGQHLDDWIMRAEWRLSQAVILGYPPIPFTTGPELISASAEINAVTWTRAQSHASFILSAMPRGGFSGGLALHEHDFALGVITQSLIQGGQPTELGFLSVLSVEPIYECLAQHKLLPECQKGGWNGFWNTETADFVGEGGLMVASVSCHDDGKRFYFEVNAREPQSLAVGADAGLAVLAGTTYQEEKLRADWFRYYVKAPPDEASTLVKAAAKAAEAAIKRTGLKQFRVLP